ncbi:MAG: dTMP kinase, partial [Parvularculales bacterium]
RAEHLDQLIRPFIEEGGWVICDRFMDSTLAYQGYARGGDKAAIKALNAQIAGDLVPDLTLFLDVSVEQSMARVDDRKTDKNPFVVYDSKEAAFHESLRCAFQEIAQDNPERVITVNGAGSPDEVAREIWSVVEVHLDPPPLPSAGTHG